MRALEAGAFGVILAAGRSRRLGQPKALLTIDGERLVARLVRIYREAGLPVRVVAADLAIARAAEAAGASVVDGDPEASMIDSLARGLAGSAAAGAGAIVQPVDAAFTDVPLLLALGQALLHVPVVPHFGGDPGHPVALPAGWFPRIAARPEGGLRTLLSAAIALPWPDPRILCDLDEPGDLARWGLASK